MSAGAIWLWCTRLWCIVQEFELPHPWYLELKHTYFEDRIFINTLYARGFLTCGGDCPPFSVHLSLHMRRERGLGTAVLTEDMQRVIIAIWVEKLATYSQSAAHPPSLRIQNIPSANRARRVLGNRLGRLYRPLSDHELQLWSAEDG